MDIDDKESELVVRAEAPGFAPEEIDIQVNDQNNLVIRAEHKEEEQAQGRSSFRYGKFERTVSLPRGVEVDKIDAHCRNGVLEVHVPKGEAAKGRRIEVKAN
jgi:HSP20 family protein